MAMTNARTVSRQLARETGRNRLEILALMSDKAHAHLATETDPAEVAKYRRVVAEVTAEIDAILAHTTTI